MAQVIRSKVEVEVLVDDVIFYMEVFAVAGRLRLVARFEGREVEPIWKGEWALLIAFLCVSFVGLSSSNLMTSTRF